MLKSSDGTRDVAATAPATPLEEPLAKTSGRSQSGGGYGDQFARQAQAGDLGWGQDNHRDPLAPVAPGGADEGWWARGVHAGD
jgi:hypothetical protein